MRILIIGYGSIGKRHKKVLSSIKAIEAIDIVTKQCLKNEVTFKDLKSVNNLNKYDYFIIASETHKHYDQLKFLENNVKGKMIFCEKPLFDTFKNLEIKNNEVYVGYVLRFHPLLQKVKELVKNDKLINIHVNCGQYLPTWRPSIDYKNSYSAKKEKGGGVLLDLSHEIDYTQWLCGSIEEIKSYQMKISDLQINSDDIATFIGITKMSTLVNLSVDYISKISYRKILLNTINYTYDLDLINNTLVQADKNGNKHTIHCTLTRNEMFLWMHQAVMEKSDNLCTYKEALEVMKTISKIQEQNK